MKKEGKKSRDARKKHIRIKINHERSPMKLVVNSINKDKSRGLNIENMTIKEIEEYVESL